MASLYAKFWFAVQFWLPPEKRRPFTFMMRDLYFKYPLVVITLGGIAIYLLGRYTAPTSNTTLVIAIVVLLAGELLGHLFWGKKYKPDEQEDPQYLGDNDIEGLDR